MEVYRLYQNKFTDDIKALMRTGLTKEELAEFIRLKSVNLNVSYDMNELFNTIEIQKLSAEKLLKYVSICVRNSYSVGAS